MEINKLTNLNVNTELYTNGVAYDDETVESETIKNADYKVSNDSVDEDSGLDIADEKDKVVAESSEKKDTSNVGTEQTFSENGVVIKYTLNSEDAEFSCKSNKSCSVIWITAKNCTINVNEAPSNAELRLSDSSKNVTLNSNVQLKSIKSSADDSTINGSQYDDNITNSGKNCTINAGAGNDTIKNTGKNSTINGEDGNDTIDNSGAISKINGGCGDDTITSTSNVCAKDGNSGNYTVINGDEGDDKITVQGTYAEVNGGDGNDNITGENLTKSKINGGAGNDYIVNYGGQMIGHYSSNAEEVKDKYTFKEEDATVIEGGEGEDTINNLAYNVIIDNAEETDNISIHQYKTDNDYWQKIDTKINYKDGTSIDMAKDDYSDKENITLNKTGNSIASYLRYGASYEDYVADYNGTDCHGWNFKFGQMKKYGISYWYKFTGDGTCSIYVGDGMTFDTSGYTYVDNSKKT